MTSSSAPVALVTGASRGFGRALSAALVERGWTVVVDARDTATAPDGTTAVRGDITDSTHRRALRHAVERIGRLDLLVNNASTLGTLPLPTLATHDLSVLAQVFEVNVIAPLALTQEVLPLLGSAAGAGAVVNVSSDAAVEGYEGWGGYGASKAALDQMTRVLAAENPTLAVYAFDPGDMRTQMHQDAFPGEDISDRPLPEEVAVPALLTLLDRRPASGRYRAADLLVSA